MFIFLSLFFLNFRPEEVPHIFTVLLTHSTLYFLQNLPLLDIHFSLVVFSQYTNLAVMRNLNVIWCCKKTSIARRFSYSCIVAYRLRRNAMVNVLLIYWLLAVFSCFICFLFKTKPSSDVALCNSTIIATAYARLESFCLKIFIPSLNLWIFLRVVSPN